MERSCSMQEPARSMSCKALAPAITHLSPQRPRSQSPKASGMAQHGNVPCEQQPWTAESRSQSERVLGRGDLARPVEEPAERSGLVTGAREQASLVDPLPAGVTHGEEQLRRTADPSDEGAINLETSRHSAAPAVEAGTRQQGNGEVPTCAEPMPSLSLAELSSLIQREKYQRLQCRDLASQVRALLLSSGVSRRLIRCIQSAYRSLVNRYRTDQKDDFVTVYNALVDLHGCCDSPLWTRSPTPRSQTVDAAEPWPMPSPSWIANLPSESQEIVVGFMSKIRTEPGFLARRIASLPPSELSAIIFPHQSPSVVESIIHSHSLGKAQTSRTSNSSAYVSFGVDHLRHLQRCDRLSSLLYTVFDDSSELGSHEDIRRSDVWSTACASVLVGANRGSDRFVETVLDIWASLRAWEIKPQLEVFLLKLLQDGASLLEPPNSQRTGFNEPVVTTTIPEFFDQALDAFFKLLGARSTHGSLPGGVLDFVRAILRKIKDPEQARKARNDIILGWCFSKFFYRVITYPESQGICTNYHITDSLRQRILKELAIRVQKQVSDVVSPWKHTGPVVPGMRTQIEQFIDLFDVDASAEPQPSFFTSSREEQDPGPQSYLLISPSDFATMVQALFPDAQSLSDLSYNSVFDPMESSASFFTASSIRTSDTSDPQSALNSSTAASISGTSMTSNTISNVAPVDEAGQALPGPTTDCSENAKHGVSENDDNYGQKLRTLCDGLWHLVGSATPAGSCHPAAEDWAVVYIECDGGLSLNESYNLEGHVDSEHNTDLATDDDLAKDYELVKEATARLVDDRYLHHHVLTERRLRVISVRDPQGIQRPEFSTFGRSLNAVAADRSSHEFGGMLPRPEQSEGSAESGTTDESGPALAAMFGKAFDSSQARYDFQSAQFWWRSQRAVRVLLTKSSASTQSNHLLTQIAQDFETKARKWRASIEQSNSVLLRLTALKHDQGSILRGLELESKALRDKMWYFSEVIHSSRYDDAKKVTLALRAMANPTRGRQRHSGLSSWARHRLKSSIGHDRTDGQILEAMTVPADHGGPMKLGDEQVELTTKWLTERSIENFCKGEERIHRFCFEIQKCVNRLTGDSLLKSPDLWSSSLYTQEKRIFDRGSREVHTQLDSQAGLGSNRSSTSQLNSNPSFQFPWTAPRSTNADTLNYGIGNTGSRKPGARSREPVPLWSHNLDTLPPLSPGMRSKPPTTPHGTGMPAPGIVEAQPAGFGKRAFLDTLKQTLTSLLISDLGNLNWVQGSETDSWISEDDGQAYTNTLIDSVCTGTSTHGNGTSTTLMHGERLPEAIIRPGVTGANQLASESTPHKHWSFGTLQEAPVTNEHTETNDTKPAGGGENTLESPFPYHDAFKKLLTRFSASPDPHIKLQMLYELEILTSSWSQTSNPVDPNNHAKSSISNTTRRAGVRGIGVPRTKATRIEEVMANCEERRANTLQSGPTRLSVSSKDKCEDPSGSGTVLQSIFDDPSLRPRTLFRDLQYIAAFVPPSILDHTPRGKAFWDVGLAALALKEDHCKAKIRLADQIVAYHWKPDDNASQRRESAQPNSPNQPDPHATPDSGEIPAHSFCDEELAKYTRSSAATMYTIAAKEGFPSAARELGLFYLANPELVEPRITLLPLSKPKDVFQPVLLALDKKNREVNGSSSVTEGLDPLIFSVAFHWMEVAANGGDKDARTFLKNNSNLSAGR
ncbi:hypothetical protein LPUS_07856 [Lasallia pustulata]|uniref:Uncharacterized protein n=1 Tax=Lasallia pustulata TaxID=136370 RepID=A0A1W5D478_9LECA|nr:hypothetical protein LPUS_07856 [Lasallia pustulata]